MNIKERQAIRARVEKVGKVSPDEWHECGEERQGCPCGTVWADDFPVAKITRGKWGDEYAAIRIPEGKAIGAKAEAYMEMIAYGEIPEEQAHAIADFIAHARQDIPNLLDALEKAMELLEAAQQGTTGDAFEARLEAFLTKQGASDE